VKYADVLSCGSLSHEEILAAAYGHLVEDPPGELPRLPLPPFLMFDRIPSVERDGNRGRIVAELDVRVDAWYFQCHFLGDPVQPGCLGLDAVWQLLGFYLFLNGGQGSGRALGVKEVDFVGQIRPHNRLVRYELEVRRVSRLKGGSVTLGVGDAKVLVDGEAVYTIVGARAGIFPGIKYPDYPARSANSIGGVMRSAGESGA
jgi:3-hydroxyacyl-[acyl-carrier protein] dehydratase/trans-2-decenoyl-[acyl-carrier protein] isomerase